jgi:glucosamine--fructose-6-phosphate aminotransferase (isomerizing)
VLSIRRAPGKLRNIEEVLREHPLVGTYGIGHTRWATHGRPTEENAHPHRDCTGSIVVVHNGIVENYLELKRELTALGHKFVTETDTEIIAHLIEEERKTKPGPMEVVVRRVVKRLTGAFALGILCADEPDKIVVARYGRSSSASAKAKHLWLRTFPAFCTTPAISTSSPMATWPSSRRRALRSPTLKASR